jgi:hypothetical protein
METALSSNDFASVTPLDREAAAPDASSDWVELLGPLDRVPYRTTSRDEARSLARRSLEVELLELVDGASTLERIVELSGRGEDAFRALLELRVRGLLTMKRDESRP